MFTIDDKIDQARIIQFASQAKHINSNLRKDFDKYFENDKTPDFYNGLISGYTNSYVMMQGINPDSETTKMTGLIIAYLAEKIVETTTGKN